MFVLDLMLLSFISIYLLESFLKYAKGSGGSAAGSVSISLDCLGGQALFFLGNGSIDWLTFGRRTREFMRVSLVSGLLTSLSCLRLSLNFLGWSIEIKFRASVR